MFAVAKKLYYFLMEMSDQRTITPPRINSTIAFTAGIESITRIPIRVANINTHIPAIRQIMVNVSVFMRFYIKKGQRKGIKNKLMYMIIPLIGAIILIFAFFFIGTGAKILGGIWFGIGFIYLLVKTKCFKELPPEMHFEE